MATIPLKKPVKPGTVIRPQLDGTVRLTHSRTLKQSIGYQTADLTYGAEIVVHDTPKDIENGIARLEDLVTGALAENLPETRKLLKTLAAQNR